MNQWIVPPPARRRFRRANGQSRVRFRRFATQVTLLPILTLLAATSQAVFADATAQPNAGLGKISTPPSPAATGPNGSDPDAAQLCADGQCPPVISPLTYFGHPAYRLTDQHCYAVVVPDLGRVMSYGAVGGRNWLWNAPTPHGTDVGGWTNYGGNKTWLGPQDAWVLFNGKSAWPPDKAFDGSAYSATVLSGGHLVTTSPLSPGTGIRITREYYFDTNGDFVIAQSARKYEGPPLRASIWSITQTATGDAYFLPVNPDSPYKGDFDFLVSGPPSAVQPQSPTLIRVNPSTGLASNFKLGADVPVSAIATVRGQTAFVERAPMLAGTYPDGAVNAGFPVELFVNTTRNIGYAETELLSPILYFTVGTRWQHTVRWSLHDLPSANLESPEDVEALDSLLHQTDSPEVPRS